MTNYPFLSADWVKAAKELRNEYADRIPASPVEARVNVIVTDVPHDEGGALEGHIDTSSGQTIIEQGHLDDPELTVTVDYATARAAFVTRDQQEVMGAFLSGRILVDGDATKLLALQPAGPTDVDPALVEMYERLDAMTSKDS